MITRDDDLIFEAYQDSNLLLEKTIKYFVPKDKEQLLFDFYMMMNLNGIIQETDVGTKMVDGQEVATPTARMGGVSENLQDSFDQAKEKILKYLKPHLLDAVFYSICAETRHIYDETHGVSPSVTEDYAGNPVSLSDLKSYVNTMLSEDGKAIYQVYEDAYVRGQFGGDNDEDQIQPFTREGEKRMAEKNNNKFSYTQSYKAAMYAVKKTGAARANFVKMSMKFYKDLRWTGAYGGDKWAEICKGWLLLAGTDSDNELEVMTAIDHVYHLQHNTSTVFNKLNQYYKSNTGYNWVLSALNKRENIDSPYVLYDDITPTMRRMSGYILKAAGYEGWDKYIKDNKKPTAASKPTAEPTAPKEGYIKNGKRYYSPVANMTFQVTNKENINLLMKQIYGKGWIKSSSYSYEDFQDGIYKSDSQVKSTPFVVMYSSGTFTLKEDLSLNNKNKKRNITDVEALEKVFDLEPAEAPIDEITKDNITDVVIKIDSNQEGNETIKKILESGKFIWERREMDSDMYAGTHYIHYPFIAFTKVGNKYDLDIINYDDAKGKAKVQPETFFEKLNFGGSEQESESKVEPEGSEDFDVSNSKYNDINIVAVHINSNEEANKFLRTLLRKNQVLDKKFDTIYNDFKYKGEEAREFPYITFKVHLNTISINAFPTPKGKNVISPKQFLAMLNKIENTGGDNNEALTTMFFHQLPNTAVKIISNEQANNFLMTMKNLSANTDMPFKYHAATQYNDSDFENFPWITFDVGTNDVLMDGLHMGTQQPPKHVYSAKNFVTLYKKVLQGSNSNTGL